MEFLMYLLVIVLGFGQLFTCLILHDIWNELWKANNIRTNKGKK